MTLLLKNVITKNESLISWSLLDYLAKADSQSKIIFTENDIFLPRWNHGNSQYNPIWLIMTQNIFTMNHYDPLWATMTQNLLNCFKSEVK